MDALAIRIAHDYQSRTRLGHRLDTFSEVTVNPSSGHPSCPYGGGGMVLLIGCANLAT